MSAADLLTLQGNIKKDADGYKEEFYLQYRHYQALLDIFQLTPSKESKELGELAMFVAQVCKAYPRTTENFAPQLMGLLDQHHQLLEPALRRNLVQALILLRNRNQLSAAQLLPLFFKLFKCQDKQLRQMLFKHMIADIKSSNKKSRNDKLNRQLQNFMYGVVADDDEAAAKKALAVCTELWRRNVWRDARTVNVIASAAYHKSSRVMLAAVKFFLGTDKGDEDLEEEGKGEDGDAEVKPKAPTKEEVYKAMHAGTRSSKKKKQAKLKRVMATVKKAERKEEAKGTEGFAALQLLHDPQTFAERLFARLQSGNERFETRMAMMSVISRVIGVHKLLVLNFYPFLQKYTAPHVRDVTLVLTALVGATHELVPPDTMAPVLRQLVDQFVHDKARPEVMTLGLKTVRELCLRSPLIMTQELLSDLTEYKKFRNKYVASAAKGLIGLFRELQPELLHKKDRGRGADLGTRPAVYGAQQVAERVDGAELLQAAEEAGLGSSDDEVHLSSDDSDADSDLVDLDSGDLQEDSDGGGEGRQNGVSGSGDGEDGEAEDSDSDLESLGSSDLEELGSSDLESIDGEEGEEEDGEGEEGSEGGEARRNGVKRKRGAEEEEEEGSSEGEEDDSGSGSEAEEDEEERVAAKQQAKAQEKPKLAAQKDSLSALKKRLAEAKQKKREEEEAVHAQDQQAAQGPKIEELRLLTEGDFERIKRLKQKQLIEAAMAKHGLKKMTKAKKARLMEAAEEEAEEMMALREKLTSINEAKVNPKDLEGGKKRAHDKESRLASVMAGREGRDKFGSSKGRKKDKTGGLSERQKQRNKAMPVVARVQQLKNRAQKSRQKNNPKHFKGHHRG